MRSLKCMRLLASAMLLLFLFTTGLWGQTTGTVTGTVTDKTGAVVGNATIELRDIQTNAPRTTKTNSAGQYTLSNIPSGTYKLTVTAPNFRQAVVPSLVVGVGRSTAANFSLEVGQVTQVVEVTAGAGTELQTLNATVGNVIDQNTLQNMPTLSRDATSLLLLQPLAVPGYNSAPGFGAGNSEGGQVAGSRMDQNTFMIDGGDATSNTEAGGGYNTGFSATPRAAVPTPVESLEEFKVSTNNQILFSRSAGGEVQMVTRRGNNTFHGAVYDYNQNTIYNANLWELNNTNQPRPTWLDNRFGARLGGPIFKDKTFFFMHYEGRRFKKGVPFSRAVPSALMRQGILQFNGQQFNIKDFDPRGVGVSPVVSAIWAKLPQGNNPGAQIGIVDGVNVLGFTTTVPIVQNEDFAVARLDHKISDNWDAMVSYRYSVSDNLSDAQVDITGGVAKAVNQRPLQPRYLVAGLTGRLTSTLTNDFRFNWLRHWWEWKPVRPSPQVPGTAAAVTIGSEARASALIPVNFDTQNARGRTWNGHDYTFNDSVSWLKGTHLISFGGEVRRQTFLHLRDDKVIRGLVNPVYQVLDSNNINGNLIPKPAGLSGSQISRWNNFFASTTGMVDFATVLLTRNGNLDPNPPGTQLKQDAIVNAYQLQFSDTWKMTPSFTLTYGLTWSVQLPPYEREGRATMITDLSTGKIIDYDQFLKQRISAAQNGQVFNPTLGFATMKQLGRKYPYDPDWHNFGPRFAFAWNPSATDSIFGRLLGDRKTVLRGGYSRMYDRMNGVGIVMTPALGIGFGNQVSCRGPRVGGACGGAGSGAADAFRIGVDGSSLTLPTLAPITSPVIPGVKSLVPQANSPFETLDFRIDPHRKVGTEDTFTLNIQREMPWNSLLEIGYVGRLGRHLPLGVGLNQFPYMYTAGGQTFADAYDNVARAVRNGTPVTPQPFFEATQGPGGTVAAATDFSDLFLDGIVNDLTSSLCLTPAPAGGTCKTLDTLTPAGSQFLDSNVTASNGNSNYNAGYVSFRKSMSAGLTFTANYTWSRSMDIIGLNQESVANASDTFNLMRDYGPSLFDRRHIFNFFYNYELPFGRGKRWATSGFLDKLIGGWSWSGIYTASSGLQAEIENFGSCQEFGQGGALAYCSSMVPIKPLHFTSSVRYGSTGSTTSGANPEVGSGVTVGDAADPASGGSGLQVFANPAAVYENFRRPLFSDQRLGRGNIRALPRWNFDMGVAKVIKFTERVGMRLDLQAINVFNTPQFTDTQFLDFSDPSGFGVVSTQYNAPRFLQIGIRLDF